MATAIKSESKSRDRMESTEAEKAARPIWETVAEIGAQIPEEEWEKVPDDSSVNYKHRLYGAPVKQP